MNITAMSFNLRINRWLDLYRAWPFRKERAAEAILAQKPWVLGTQEADSGMLHDLGQHLPEYVRIGEGRRGGNSGEFNAVFYHKKKLGLKDWGQFWLSKTPECAGSKGWDARYPRICTWGRFKILREPGRELRVYNTHLDHMGETARMEGALLIWSVIQEHQVRFGPSYVLLSGDLNAGPSDPVVRFLSGELDIRGQRADLANAFADPRYAGRTFHGFQGGKAGEPIDYLFGGFGLEPQHGDVNRSKYGGRYPSDHYPVTGVFRLKPIVS